MRILLSIQSDLTASCRLHQSRHEEAEKGTSLKKCDTDKKVQHACRIKLLICCP